MEYNKPILVKDWKGSNAGFFIHRKNRILKDFYYGLKYGYPLCCIINFILLTYLKLPAALTMDKIFGDDEYGIEYVRCIKHRKINYYEN